MRRLLCRLLHGPRRRLLCGLLRFRRPLLELLRRLRLWHSLSRLRTRILLRLVRLICRLPLRLLHRLRLRLRHRRALLRLRNLVPELWRRHLLRLVARPGSAIAGLRLLRRPRLCRLVSGLRIPRLRHGWP